MYPENGLIQLRIVGKLTGFTARGGLSLLRAVFEQGKRGIMIDLRDVTSVDSIGVSILNFLHNQAGKLNVQYLPPVNNYIRDGLVSISGRNEKVNLPEVG
jgi:anti-anti-sigma regulatory factor